MMFRRPRVTVDWTIRMADIIAVLVFVIGGLMAYADLKSDVRLINGRAEAKYLEYDKLWVMQQTRDAAQDERIVRVYTTLSGDIKDAKNEIRQDIRDLNDAIRKNGK